MATTPQNQGGFYSTPAFEIFRRGLIVQTVKKFRGLNAYVPLTQLTPDVASDLLNVLVTSSGQLAKLRLPVPLTAQVGGITYGPYSFWDFQQAVGTRQVLSHFGPSLYYFTNDFSASTLIETNNLNLSPWSFVEANNILFGANGTRMQKWTGTAWQQWGIAEPLLAPTTASYAAPGAATIVNITNISGTSMCIVTTTGGTNFSTSSMVGTPNCTVVGNTNAFFNANWLLTNYLFPGPPTGTQFEIYTPGVLSGATGTGGTIAQINPVATGWTWGYAYKNSVTGHVGVISPFSGQILPQATFAIKLTAAAPTDPQVDTIVWYRTLDGGGDFFRECEVNLATGAIAATALGGMAATAAQVGGVGQFIVLNDNNTADSTLDLTTRASFINNPPPQGTYTALAQGRVFVAGLVGAGSDVAYSGYEQIVTGRPEESFPPNNRLRLALGAESVVGLGVLHSGIVMFSNTGKMWMLRGAVEDVTQNAPIAFTEFLEELPWTLGCLSHYTIQSTSYGLVWLAGDKTVQFWDGASQPVDISEPVYPILRSITPGTEHLCAGAYFNWLERDWYALTCATNGAGAPNTVIFWSIEKDSQQIDCFVSTLQADWLGIVSTSKLQRKLLLSHGGVISEVPVRATDIGGITNDFTTYPPTSGTLPAYWRSGYFGNDSPEQSKMWRWVRLVTDGGVTSYQVQARYVDDANLIASPYIAPPVAAQGMRTPLNRRGYRASIEIDFPEADAPMNVLEMQVAFIGTSQR